MVAMIPRKPLAPNNDRRPLPKDRRKQAFTSSRATHVHDQSIKSWASPGRQTDGGVGGGNRVLRSGRP